MKIILAVYGWKNQLRYMGSVCIRVRPDNPCKTDVGKLVGSICSLNGMGRRDRIDTGRQRAAVEKKRKAKDFFCNVVDRT